MSDRADCRRWLEDALLGMEANGLLNATREYHPPHYHVAIFPSQYLAYAEARMAEEAAARAEEERRALELLAARSQPLVTASVAKKVDVEQDEGRDPLVLLLATAGVGAFVGGRRALRRLKG